MLAHLCVMMLPVFDCFCSLVQTIRFYRWDRNHRFRLQYTNNTCTVESVSPWEVWLSTLSLMCSRLKSCSVTADAIPAQGATVGELLHLFCDCGHLVGTSAHYVTGQRWGSHRHEMAGWPNWQSVLVPSGTNIFTHLWIISGLFIYTLDT